ncbi:MAG: hypothetical protein JXB50_08065 [Spirochaetes bacterium]|nr:hypothetical protein [Spirochaetota bacterium]
MFKYDVWVNENNKIKTVFKDTIIANSEIDALKKLHEICIDNGIDDHSKYNRHVTRAQINFVKADCMIFYDSKGNELDLDKIKRTRLIDFEIKKRYEHRVDVFVYTHIFWSYNDEELIFNQYTKKLKHKDDFTPLGGPEIEKIDYKEFKEAFDEYIGLK